MLELGPVGLAVRGEHDLRAARAQVACGLLADLADADQQDPAAVQVAEDLLGERRGCRRHRRRALADRRLRANLAAGVQRLPEDAVEQLSGRARLVRGAHLAEDLALARYERVEAGGDAEEMERGRLVAQAVERGLDLRLELGERRDRTLLGLVDVFRHDIELRAVARREADRLAELSGEQCRMLTVERDPLSQLDRRVMVRGADENEAHHAKWVTGRASRTRITSAKPASATYAARRPDHPVVRSTR